MFPGPPVGATNAPVLPALSWEGPTGMLRGWGAGEGLSCPGREQGLSVTSSQPGRPAGRVSVEGLLRPQGWGARSLRSGCRA